MTYECHITCHVKDKADVQEIGEDNGWSFSCIDGDPILGAKPFCYLTCHGDAFKVVKARLDHICDLLEDRYIFVIRRKIEHIVYDTKTGVGITEGTNE